MCKLGLKDVYFMAPIQSWSQKFIRFQFQGRTNQFTCLPFGLSSAPRIFTKLLKPVTRILENLGFLINMAKSIFIPGNHRGLHKYDVSPPRRESSCNPEGVSSLGKLTSSFSQSALSYNREVNLLRNRSSSGSLTLSGDLTFEKQQHSLPACQQCRYSSGSPCSRGSKLVGRQSSPRK